jgi:hypothetical protein
MKRRRKPQIQLAAATLSGESSLREHGPTTFIVGELPKAGRHPNFSDAEISQITAALEPFIHERKATLGRWPYREDPEVLRFVRRLIVAGGLVSSDKIAVDQIVAPVLRRLNPRRRRRQG